MGLSLLFSLAARGLGRADGDLRQQDGGEDGDAADQLHACQPLAKDDPAAQDAEDGFQAHDKRGDRRMDMLLPDDLEHVGDGA